MLLDTAHQHWSVRALQVNYWPSNVQHTKEVESDRYTLTTQHVNGMAVKEDLPPVEGGIGDFRQAGDRIRDMDEGRCVPWYPAKGSRFLPAYLLLHVFI